MMLQIITCHLHLPQDNHCQLREGENSLRNPKFLKSREIKKHMQKFYQRGFIIFQKC